MATGDPGPELTVDAARRIVGVGGAADQRGPADGVGSFFSRRTRPALPSSGEAGAASLTEQT